MCIYKSRTAFADYIVPFALAFCKVIINLWLIPRGKGGRVLRVLNAREENFRVGVYLRI